MSGAVYNKQILAALGTLQAQTQSSPAAAAPPSPKPGSSYVFSSLSCSVRVESPDSELLDLIRFPASELEKRVKSQVFENGILQTDHLLITLCNK